MQITLTKELLERWSPENCAPVDPEFLNPHTNHTKYGTVVASRSSCVFVGLARQIGGLVSLNLDRLEFFAKLFADYGFVIVENDSTDSTKAELEAFAATPGGKKTVCCTDRDLPHLHGFEKERTKNLAMYRNECIDLIKSEHGTPDYVCVVDLDVWGGYAGLFNGLSHLALTDDAAGMASVSLFEHGLPDGTTRWMHYDQWAFRWHGYGERFGDWFPYWTPPCGSPPIEVKSAFGGMAIYKGPDYLSGARYKGGDCEHVLFHNRLARMTGKKMYLNPSQRVSVESRAIAQEEAG
jgi:glycosyltransferase involved in cell wall biosynthesis